MLLSMADTVQQITPNAPQTAVVDPLHVTPRDRPGHLPGSTSGAEGDEGRTGLVDPFAEVRAKGVLARHMPND